MNAEELRRLSALVAIIKQHGDFAYGNSSPEDVAIEWDDYDFQAEEVDAWLTARCFCPDAAHELTESDISPEQAGEITDEKVGGYVDTIGYKISNNDLDIDEVIELIDGLSEYVVK